MAFCGDGSSLVFTEWKVGLQQGNNYGQRVAWPHVGAVGLPLDH